MKPNVPITRKKKVDVHKNIDACMKSEPPMSKNLHNIQAINFAKHLEKIYAPTATGGPSAWLATLQGEDRHPAFPQGGQAAKSRDNHE